MASPNIVPLIDILLVLIIIFMVITPLTPKGLDALVPQPSPNQQQNVELENKTVVVQVLMNDKLKINNEDTTWEALGPRMEQIFKDRAEKVAFVKGDNDVLFMDVARAIDIMKRSRHRQGRPDHRQARGRSVSFSSLFSRGCESPPRRVNLDCEVAYGYRSLGGKGGIVVGCECGPADRYSAGAAGHFHDHPAPADGTPGAVCRSRQRARLRWPIRKLSSFRSLRMARFG